MSEDGGDHIHPVDPAFVVGPSAALNSVHRHCWKCQEEHTMKVFAGERGVTWLRCPCCLYWTRADIENTEAL